MKRDLNKVSDGFIDLNPINWQSDRQKPHEPFWGKDWPGALAYLIGFTIMMTVVHYLR
jgi:hypothetical protein